MSGKISGFLGKLRSNLRSPSPRSTQAVQFVTIVSGLPRSGTSMMMKMLDAGGIPPLTDELRRADDDNPQGYYEFERVKQLGSGDTTWLQQAPGKAVKVIAALLKHLPPDYSYRVIFMRREMNETLQSQKRMLIRRGEATDKISDEELKTLYRKHLQDVEAWLSDQPNFRAIEVSYNDVLKNPVEQAHRVNRLLGDTLDVEKMVRVIDHSLYRQRKA